MGALERDRVRFAPFADGFDAVRDRGALGYAAVVDNLEAAIMDCGVNGRAAPDIFPAAVKNGCAGGRAAILDKFQTAVMNVRVGGLAAADNFPPAVVDRRSVDFAVDDMDDPAVIDRGSDRFAIDKLAAAGVHCRFDVPAAGEDKLEATVMDRRAEKLAPGEDAFYAPVVDACVEGLARGVDVQMIAGVQDEVVLCRRGGIGRHNRSLASSNWLRLIIAENNSTHRHKCDKSQMRVLTSGPSPKVCLCGRRSKGTPSQFALDRGLSE